MSNIASSYQLVSSFCLFSCLFSWYDMVRQLLMLMTNTRIVALATPDSAPQQLLALLPLLLLCLVGIAGLMTTPAAGKHHSKYIGQAG